MRDAEAVAIREVLADLIFAEVFETGFGTGGNTEWLAAKAPHVTAANSSAEILSQAKEKNKNISFQQADITAEWNFAKKTGRLCFGNEERTQFPEFWRCCFKEKPLLNPQPGPQRLPDKPLVNPHQAALRHSQPV